MILAFDQIHLFATEIGTLAGDKIDTVTVDQLFSFDSVTEQAQKMGNTFLETFALRMALLVTADNQIGTGIVTAAGRLGLCDNLLAHHVDSTFQIVIGFCYRSIGARCCVKFFSEEQTLIKRNSDQFGRGQAKGFLPDFLSFCTQIEFISNRRCNQDARKGWQCTARGNASLAGRLKSLPDMGKSFRILTAVVADKNCGMW